jgi:hypothetical protein
MGMKGNRLLLTLFFLLSCASTVSGEFNPFQQRKIVIQQFENRSEEAYDYLGEAITNSIHDFLLSVPYIILTDEERAALKQLALLERYEDRFEEAGGTVLYRLSPIVIDGAELEVSSDTAVLIYGFYEVGPDEKTTLLISAYSGLTGREYVRYKTEEDLYTIIKSPESYLTHFFKLFLRYKTHTVLLTAEPRDALIFVDDGLVGVGETKGILLTPGTHRITVKKGGYRSFSDLIGVNEDGFSRHMVLEEEKLKSPVEYAVTPHGTRIYREEKYEGVSPLSFGLSDDDRTVTFVKEGYVRRTVPVEEIEGLERYKASLVTHEIKQKLLKKAELHRRGSEALYYTGIGMVGVSILLGIEKTAYQQKADLYSGVDADRYSEALGISNTLTYLTTASVAVTAGIFIFSFIEMLKYFDLYDGAEYNLLKGEVRF